MADSSGYLEYAIDRCEIRIAADGNSAVIVEQLILHLVSLKNPFSGVYHVMKYEEKWLIDFMSYNLIPKNEDLTKFNTGLE